MEFSDRLNEMKSKVSEAFIGLYNGEFTISEAEREVMRTLDYVAYEAIQMFVSTHVYEDLCDIRAIPWKKWTQEYSKRLSYELKKENHYKFSDYDEEDFDDDEEGEEEDDES